MEERKEKKKGRFLGLWIASGIFFAISVFVTLYFQLPIYKLIGSEAESLGDGIGKAFGSIVLIALMVIFSGVSCSVTIILSTIGMFLTIFKRPNGFRVGQLIYFIVLILLSVALFFSFTVVLKFIQ